jgi:hypothetical protein
VNLVRADVSEERIASTIRVTNLRSLLRLLVTANVVPSSPILVNLMMWAIRFYETLVLTRATRRNTPEDGILHDGRSMDPSSAKILSSLRRPDLFSLVKSGRRLKLTTHLKLVARSSWCNVRFEVFTAVTMKNAVFRGIKTQFVPHRRHITSPVHSQTH